jgi:predicted double-glycine peptidase
MDAKSFFDTSEERKQVYLLLVHLKDQKQDDIDFTDTGKEITVVYQDPLLKNDDIYIVHFFIIVR